MISFIIIEENNKTLDLIIKIIKKFLYESHDYYKIHEFNTYNNLIWKRMEKVEGKRIYIISSELTNTNSFDLARKIRKNLSIEDPILIIAPKGKKYNVKNFNNTLILSIVEQNKSFLKNMFNSLETAYLLVTNNHTLTFSSFDEVYRLPYDDIYYIEKDTHDDTITIYTKDDSYTHYISIKKMAMKLADDTRFFKTHRSCIINIFKVSSFNCKNNIIEFDNGLKTSLVSKEKKKSLVDRLKKQI